MMIIVYCFFNFNSIFLIFLVEIGLSVFVGLFNKMILGFIVKICVIYICCCCLLDKDKVFLCSLFFIFF